ncbi:GyrI-like domain-containing protein [Candidatus Chloroploca sp. M-50]|uniref:GyrI-like domain-containing protein n=1 Tax=Candidatus Chloroploca mongolica TaxID=2528176 RepID=A0ABS4D7W9_9CHLR|nr:GyrI-like domain-containing protein [Candidatus Chloroploca mongolica]MBP1465520.1 GyrI-like domain-containing protein [Candidatus Chloroploca mongolica]
MQKIDLKKELQQLYQPSAKEVVQVDVPTMNYLMIDGEGDPNISQVYANAIEALFAVSYAVKFMIKKGPLAIDYGVMPLEGLWWADDMSTFLLEDKANWKWTMMIMQPDFVTVAMIDSAIADVRKKKNPAAISRVRFEPLAEGTCAQILHLGPFSEEGPTIEKVHAFIDARGKRTGKHHEIYLSDIRKADPSKWKTIIRQPML